MSRIIFGLLLVALPLSAQVTVTVPRTTVNVNPVITPITNPMIDMNLDLARVLTDTRLELGRHELQNSLNEMQYTLADLDWRNSLINSNLASAFSYSFGSATAPAPWAKDDPADSLYKAARESLNRGDYRKAASQFDEIPKRFPKSAYVKDAPYWRAFALYRVGGTPELTEALAALDKYRVDNPPPAKSTSGSSRNGPATTYTSSWSSSDRPDVDGLSARIAGVLASRGMGENAAVKSALARAGDACDSEDQSVKAEALSALMQNNAEQGRAMAAKILARRDDCSVPLRRNALLVLAAKHDATAVSTLIATAKNDPNNSIRNEAINWLGRASGDDALNALEELSRNTDTGIQRAAMQAIGNSPNPRAKAVLRGFVERSETSETLRLTAIDGFSKETTSADDAAWLRGLYPKSTLRVQERIVSTIGRIGGEANDQWLIALARREEEPASVRSMVLQRVGRTMDIASLSKFYDTASNRQMRESVIGLLSARTEPAAVDKLIDIVKNGTDPNVRRTAIAALAKSKDPRAAKLLLELVDK